MAESSGRGKARRGAVRRKILAELCEGRRTANELAGVFGISGTAVRDHLMILRAEGMVKHRVERRGPGKPTHVYELTADGELMLSRAYLPVLSAILTGIERDDGADALEARLREAGKALAAERPRPSGSEQERVKAGVTALRALGAIVEVRKVDSRFLIQGRCCPLASLSPRMPQVCKMLESLLSETTGGNARERCNRERPPHCGFEIAFARAE